jgi:hypothetical protein
MKRIFILALLFLLSACKSGASATPTNTRWIEYENALSDAIVHEKGICEWEIWGHVSQEVYVWAVCQVENSEQGAAGSVPAVIYLASNGNIEKVAIPRDGVDYNTDIKSLFPSDVQTLINSNRFDAKKAMEHIEARRQNHSLLPMIVEAGVTLP